MKKPQAIVMMFPGTNCNSETRLGLEMAGFNVVESHVNEILGGDTKLEDFHLLALAGGFSYGDDIASGKVAANKLMYSIREQMLDFAEENLIIGICNGFQILVKAGLLPALRKRYEIQATLTYNDLGHFYCNWIKIKNFNKSKCIYTRGLETLDVPVAHGEGKFLLANEGDYKTLEENDQVVFRYVRPDASPAAGAFPHNPANTSDDIAGVCDPSGRILGMMPHPERYLFKQNHPQWTAGKGSDEENGLQIFKNARNYVVNNLL
ncbi:MAG: phosphoribosylformylglycinamidine synthase subunit PurQ [Promethearchaeota archaeon]